MSSSVSASIMFAFTFNQNNSQRKPRGILEVKSV